MELLVLFLLYADRVTPIIESDRIIFGVAKTWKVPWIVRLNGCRPRTKRLNGPRFSRQNVYLRWMVLGVNTV